MRSLTFSPRPGSRPARWWNLASTCSSPTIRLGVTGLSRSGKTVFITALVHGLMQGGRFPVFEPLATGRIARARLAPQPDDAVPRFDYEGHVRALVDERALAGIDRPHQRAAPGHRLPVAARRRPHPHHRHRRLSGRMAARPAAARQELPAMVGRKPAIWPPRAARADRRAVARLSGDARSAGAAGRAGGAAGGARCLPSISRPAATSATP